MLCIDYQQDSKTKDDRWMLMYIYHGRDQRGEGHKLRGCVRVTGAEMGADGRKIKKESGPEPACRHFARVWMPMVEYLMLLASRYTYEQTQNALVEKISVVLNGVTHRSPVIPAPARGPAVPSPVNPTAFHFRQNLPT